MKHNRGTRNQRGIVLLLALVALLLISAVGASLLYMATASVRIVGAQQASARAFYSSLGGLEEGRYRILPVLSAANGGLNFLRTQVNPVAVYPCTALEEVPTRIPCNTVGDPGRYGARPAEVLYIVNDTNLVVTDDNDVAAEIPGYTSVAISTLQADPGGRASVPWSWLRINLKTEAASGEDIDFDGLSTSQLPVFLYMGRQFNMDDLAAFDPDGAGPKLPGSVLPFPWGPNPLAAVPSIEDRPCVHVLCASPIYTLTAKSVEPSTGASRIVRTEVATMPSFAVDGAMHSNPNIGISGNVEASGRDICDTDCTCTPGDPGCGLTAPFRFAGQPGFGSQDTLVTDPGRACRTVNPMQSSAPVGANNVGNNAANSDPGPDECQLFNNGQPCAVGNNAAIASNVPNPYDVGELIDLLSPDARVLTNNLAAYYPQTAPSGMSNCDTGNCRGNRTELGGFPFADPINGTGVTQITTYVPGNLRCTAQCSGAGILLVDGDLQLNGSFMFYGIIIVRGKVTTLGGGNPTTPCNIYGAIMAGGTVQTAVGGAICFQYNSCAQQIGTQSVPPRLLSFREIPE